MLNEEAIEELTKNLQRIFALPMSRSTYRELQNIVLTSLGGNKDNANLFFEALLTGEIKKDIVKNNQMNVLKKCIEQFSIPARVAKDVFERGEFVSLLTSDILLQGNRPIFLNRIRRIDGEELQFVTDIDSTMHMVQHFVNRLQEVQRDENLKPIIGNFNAQLRALQASIEELLK